MPKRQNKIIDAFTARAEQFLSYKTEDRNIKFIQGDVAGNPEENDYSDNLWEEVTLPYNWDTGNDAWFRKEIIIPEKINGISIAGSELSIRGKSTWACPVLNIQTKLYINGKEVFAAQNYMDFSFLQVVSSNISPGEKHVIAVHTYGKEGVVAFYSAMPVIEVCCSSIDNMAFELESFTEELKFAQSLPGGTDIVEGAFNGIESEDIEAMDIHKLLSLIDNIRDNMSSLKPLSKQYVIHLIGHAHIDMNWLWPMEETVDVCRDTFSTVMKLMNNSPDLCFSQSQAYTYKIIEEKYPELFKRISKRIKEGRWDITASTWVELDLNMVNGESIARQILYAKKYIKDKFNFEPKVFWSPDTFGHPHTIPQILKKSGIDYFYFMRASKKDYDLFWWKGLDGSKVLSFNGSYLGGINPGVLVKLAKYVQESQGTKTSMHIYGIGDHGGGPTAEDVRVINKLNEKPVFPKLVFSTTHNYFDAISKQDIDVPVVSDEFNPIFDGCYTTHWDTKVHNRMCERLVLTAETIAAAAKILGYKYPDLEELWKATLFNQFHDILPGSAIRPSYEYSNSQAEKTEKIAKDIISNCIKYISEKVKIESNGIPVLVFNSLSWDRTDVASVELLDNIYENPVVKDEDGNTFPAQVIDEKLIFVAEDIPSLGFKVFYICEGSSGSNSILTKPLTLENKFFTLEVNEKTGTISYLYDKINNKEVIREVRDEGAFPSNTFPLKLMTLESNIPGTVVSMNNMLQVLYEDPHYNSAWVIGPISKVENLIKNPEIEVTCNGPVAGKIRIKHKFNKSTIIQDISLYKDINKIDFNTYIDWCEKADNNSASPMLKASFTPILSSTKATFDMPFGNIERVADGREYPALNWVDISDDEYGFSLLSDTKYGFDVKGNTVRITLIRTSYEPDPDPDRGKHNFTYSIYPHKGNFMDANTAMKGYELNNPLIASYVERERDNSILQHSKSFVSIDLPNIILTCFKKAEENDDLILRVYESNGKESKSTIKLGFDIDSVEEIDLIERSVTNSNIVQTGKELTFTIKPFEIKYLLI